MLSQVFSIVAPLFLIAAVGYFYGALVRPAMHIPNRLIMDVFMPALIFHVMIQDDFYPRQYLGIMLGGLLLMLGSGFVALIVARFFGFSWRAFVPPAMFSNWGNLGLPLYVFALGEQALGAGVMLVALGNVLCFSLGIYIFSGQLKLLGVIRIPIVIAVILGLLFNIAQIGLPHWLALPIDMLGQVAIPLMLFSLGVRLTRVSWSDYQQGLAIAVLCPLVGVSLALLLCAIIPLSPLHQSILILFGALPPAVINFMLAEQYQRDPDAVASMVLIGNMGAIIALPMVLILVLARFATAT